MCNIFLCRKALIFDIIEFQRKSFLIFFCFKEIILIDFFGNRNFIREIASHSSCKIRSCAVFFPHRIEEIIPMFSVNIFDSEVTNDFVHDFRPDF